MIEVALIVLAIVCVVVALARDREEPPPATLEGGSSHLRSGQRRIRKRGE